MRAFVVPRSQKRDLGHPRVVVDWRPKTRATRQIPFGNDKQESKNKSKSKGNRRSFDSAAPTPNDEDLSLGARLRFAQDDGLCGRRWGDDSRSFAALRMTSHLLRRTSHLLRRTRHLLRMTRPLGVAQRVAIVRDGESSLVGFAEFGYYLEVFEGGGVAFDFAVGG